MKKYTMLNLVEAILSDHIQKKTAVSRLLNKGFSLRSDAELEYERICTTDREAMLNEARDYDRSYEEC